MDAATIDRYEHGGELFRQAYAGLTENELDATPIPGTWTLRQIAVHLMDSDMVATDRMKRVAAMEQPLLVYADESAIAQLEGYKNFPIAKILDLFALNRAQTAVFLRALSPQSFERYGIHTKKGKVTLAELVAMYIKHLDGHLEWVEKKRKLVRG